MRARKAAYIDTVIVRAFIFLGNLFFQTRSENTADQSRCRNERISGGERVTTITVAFTCAVQNNPRPAAVTIAASVTCCSRANHVLLIAAALSGAVRTNSRRWRFFAENVCSAASFPCNAAPLKWASGSCAPTKFGTAAQAASRTREVDYGNMSHVGHLMSCFGISPS